ncbi:DUF418 domain-containing protein [Kutzneria sp. 744]|uniref:DUF418 domain-containing protein n=1 Tax=Kutzneria sp. (strain 744) TaxID=345341 RepID=UPI0003EEC44E|nr:DUF418 domain-containing protein [Kutzneria sp. 744]EWM18918.1 membrane protein [Kutzneria sp. 744]
MSTQDTPVDRGRIVALDVVRGFALCGILLANAQPIAAEGGFAATSGQVVDPAGFGLFVEQRFMPIFSLLFGVGFSLLLRAAAGRTPSPRLLLLRRLLALLVIGVAHFVFLWHGDILSTYAVMGLLVLLPSTWLPRAAVAPLGTAFLATSLLTGDGRFTYVAGLFLLGSALVRYDVIDHTVRGVRLAAPVLAVAAVPALWWQSGLSSTDRHFPLALALTGLLLAGLYICLMLLLLRTRFGPVLVTVFAPLGRMALTNYLTATALVLVIGRLIGGHPEAWTAGTVVGIAGGILAIQWLWSTLWLRRCHYGPVEWLWRWATWMRRPPLRRRRTGPAFASDVASDNRAERQ